MYKKLFVGIVLLVVTLLLLGGCGQRGYVFPPPPSVTQEPPIVQETVVAEDSFVLQADPRSLPNASQEIVDECWEWQWELERVAYEYGERDPCYYNRLEPFNKFYLYFNYFYLQKGERVDMILRSNLPLGGGVSYELEEEEGLDCPWDLLIYVLVGKTEQLGSSELRRVDGDWELEIPLLAEEGGKSLILIGNTALEAVWCQYVVILD